MNPGEIVSLNLTQLTRAVETQEVTSVAAVEACLKAIDDHNQDLRAFIRVDREAAVRAAIDADAAIGHGQRRGPLHGIPIAHKDVFYRRGEIATAGAAIYDRVATETADVIARFDRAGAIDLGRLNLDELCAGGIGANLTFGQCRNPWNLERIPGGSSSGSGAAVSARLIPGSLGSDTGGSVRWPAAMCGIVGLKPTAGVIETQGVHPLSWNMDSVGPLARSSADCALLLDVASGDSGQRRLKRGWRELGALDSGLRGVRIGVAAGAAFSDIGDQMARRFDEAIYVLRQLGAQISEVVLERVPLLNDLQMVIRRSEATAMYGGVLADQSSKLLPATCESLQEGYLMPATRYIEALSLRKVLLREFLATHFANVDIIVSPTLKGPALRIDQFAGDRSNGDEALMQYAELSRFANYLGIPAVSTPCGMTSDGLPLGLQLMAAPYEDLKLLKISHAYEAATGFVELRPPLIDERH